ncbi:MAG: Ycf66 family protein, partial [Cyanobacteria bacterium P01_A01_bin.40]
MLSYALAIAIAISSLGLFLTAFLMSDLHRQDDFLWSGVGLFYALVLWYCAQNIT